MNPRSRIAAIVFALILILSAYTLIPAQTPDRSSAASAVRSFYAFHFAHNTLRKLGECLDRAAAP